MRLLAIGLLTAAGLLGQMPEVPGEITDQATLRYIDIKPGGGAAAGWGKQFTAHYTGWLRDGTQFDSSVGIKGDWKDITPVQDVGNGVK